MIKKKKIWVLYAAQSCKVHLKKHVHSEAHDEFLRKIKNMANKFIHCSQIQKVFPKMNKSMLFKCFLLSNDFFFILLCDRSP